MEIGSLDNLDLGTIWEVGLVVVVDVVFVVVMVVVLVVHYLSKGAQKSQTAQSFALKSYFVAISYFTFMGSFERSRPRKREL